MHWTIIHCMKCGKDRAIEYANVKNFNTGEKLSMFCKICGTTTEHTAIKKYIDYKLL